MKIVIVSSHFFPEVTACSFRLQSIVEEFKNIESSSVNLISVSPDKNIGPFFNEGYTNYRITHVADKNRNFLVRFYTELKVALKCARVTKKIKPDIIFVTTPYMAMIFAFLYFTRRKKPYWVHVDVRDLAWKYYSPSSIFIKKILFKCLGFSIERSLKFYDSISVTNELQADYLKKTINRDSMILPNGVNHAQVLKMQSVDSKKNIPDSIRISYVGNIGHAQDMSPLIKLSRLKCVEISVFGTGAQVTDFTDTIRQLNIENIQFYDAVDNDEVSKIYSESDFLYVGIKDYIVSAIPSKVYECAMSGKPVLFAGSEQLKKYLSRFENFFNVQEVIVDDIDASEEELIQCLQIARQFDVDKLRREVVTHYSRERNAKILITKILNEATLREEDAEQ